MSERVQLTREELYERVWAEPMQKLAKSFGISDVALAKHCRRMRVPVPPRGYWAKLQFKKPVRRTPLPKVSDADAKWIGKFQARTVDPQEQVEEATGPVADQQRFEAREENKIVVSEILADPHPLVAQTIKALKRAKPNLSGYLRPSGSCLHVNVTVDGADRAMCILDALLKGLDARGYYVTIRPAENEHADAKTVVRVRDEDIEIKLEEKVDVVERPDPVDPNAKPARRRYVDPYAIPRALPPRRELVATGLYTLRIDHSYLGGLRCSWSDGKQQRIAERLNDFVVGLVAVSERLKEMRLEREAREREYQAAQQRRLEEERRRLDHAARVRALESALSDWRDARDIRAYVADSRTALVGHEVPADAPILGWLAWAERYAEAIDPLRPEPTVPKDPGPPARTNYPWA